MNWAKRVVCFLAFAISGSNANAVQASVWAGCGSAIFEKPPLIETTKVLFIGEWHGTVEIPQFVTDMTCSVLERGAKVHVAVEMPADWTQALQLFVTSSDISQNEKVLFELWNRLASESPDGRTSEKMWRLIVQLKQFAQRHPGKLSISAFDSRPWEPRAPGEFAISDIGMAATLTRQIDESKSNFAIVLTGNLHARLLPNTVSFKPRPMAYLVSTARPEWQIQSWIVSGKRVSFWGCIERCGVQTLPAKQVTEVVNRIEIFEKMSDSGFSGRIFLGDISASLPFDPKTGKTRENAELKAPPPRGALAPLVSGK